MGQRISEVVWPSALRELRRVADVDLTFCGVVDDGRMRLACFDGTVTGALKELEVASGCGLGGYVWQRKSPLAVDEYGASASISHDYDRPVLAEGIRTIAAAPVMVDRRVRGVVYAGLRHSICAGDLLLDRVTRISRSIAQEMWVDEEVDRRVRIETQHLEHAHSEATELLRRVYAGLRRLSCGVADPFTRDLLAELLREFMPESGRAVVLSAREQDVLSEVATGASYAEVAQHLGLATSTVKSYMRDILFGLGAHSRHEAVIIARRQRIIP